MNSRPSTGTECPRPILSPPGQRKSSSSRPFPTRTSPTASFFSAFTERKRTGSSLVRQYRYPLGDYVYEFPAGLVESGEDTAAAGIREMYEETGLTFTPVDAGACSRPFFTTIGMTDESCGTVFGYCSGEPTSAHQESSEDIQVILADRAECKRILREENVAIMCAYMLMHFIADEGDPLAFLQKE